ncbi:MAG TPA: gamma carbonic anhydrase family protein [Caldisericia bacterium]|nr:gamma carbonic anhydrase family protein [Caldisericia bacterium]HPF48292.1 gamma carbonic anhydrase family protein [Caldisericia bacterium]HPI83529.1 gamma carbonic anhydrase family protein [Caldisericia bacterium]HPQ92745.1 gamma carbonic anhydrase family protein [Caldisericia bacterium]HRV74157.1 gamma carbonic anhydrase family protein [Caldisericia bacterium]
MLRKFEDKIPTVADGVYIADSAELIGNVKVAKKSSIWSNVVIRADINIVTIGEMSNIQEGSVVHVDHDTPTHIGVGVTVGHGAILHGCIINDYSLIGIGAIILDNAEIGEGSIIAAGSLVPPGKVIPPKSMVMGSPGKVVRELTDAEVEGLKKHAEGYYNLSKKYM